MTSLSAEGLEKVYSGRAVVRGIHLELGTGEVVGLLGPNGAGKTTTFYMIVGLVRPSQGEIYLSGVSITKLPMYQRARKGIGYLPQESSVFRKLTVRENLLAVLETMDLSAPQRTERIQTLMEDLNIAHLAKNRAYTLSGGEMRRVEITRALARDPKFLLLDEPFSGIDPIAVNDIQRIVRQLKSRGIGILITDHNVQETLQITDRAYLINDGKILLSGSAQEIAANPKARAIYLGDSFQLREASA